MTREEMGKNTGSLESSCRSQNKDAQEDERRYEMEEDDGGNPQDGVSVAQNASFMPSWLQVNRRLHQLGCNFRVISSYLVAYPTGDRV